MKHITENRLPSPIASAIPIIFLIISLTYILINEGTDAISNYSQITLLCSAGLSFIISRVFYPCSWRMFRIGFSKSATQILPAIPILILIALVSTTWMLGGIVPSMIYYGLELINPKSFLVIACIICSIISVLTGSSWTTCATIGVAFMGIGTIMGYNPAWIAGAIISGAYFGDKMSPLSDTTVLASSSCGVKLFNHIRYLLITTIPSLIITLLVFTILGFTREQTNQAVSGDLIVYIHNTFNISPILLIAPIITCTLILMRVNVLITLFVSSMLGLIGLIFFEPNILEQLAGNGSKITEIIRLCLFSTNLETHNTLLNNLVATGGISGMLNTIYLVLSAMTFGGVMLGTGMLSSITHHCLHGLKKPKSVVSSTVATGLFINSCTGDQFLSIIITSNLFRNLYKKAGLEPRLLSRTIEDSISVTSVLIPWNSCGVTQSTVLGVRTIEYFPFCLFNILCPLMSVIVVSIGYKIVRLK